MLHVSIVIPLAVNLLGHGNHLLGTGYGTYLAAFASFDVNNYRSSNFGHMINVLI